MQVNDDMVRAAVAEWSKPNDPRDHHEIMRAALTAALAHMWRPIEELTRKHDDSRILVAGWQKPSGRTAGYWWWHEDVVIDGRPMDHKDAKFWCLAHFNLPSPPKAEG